MQQPRLAHHQKLTVEQKHPGWIQVSGMFGHRAEHYCIRLDRPLCLRW